MQTDFLLLQIALGLVLSTIIAILAHRHEALTRGGALGAILVGTITFGFGGWTWGLVLIAFFAVSSALSRYRQADKRELADKFHKGVQRDMGQVVANGGLAAFITALYFSHPAPVLLAAFLGTMATVNADTWATEIGVLSPLPPRLITTWRRVPVGTSGGITLLGTTASALGALFIALLAYMLLSVEALFSVGGDLRLWWIIPVALISGLLGSLFDSLLGATVQGIFYCARCESETEKELHSCGLQTAHVRGWRWLNNDMVNFLSSAWGAMVAVALVALIIR
ncbi:MAG: DUF92 domain-containing protein [Anaerolineae bacterium]|nr:DUF92 domain-containing protein [Anaerolineae bacterium]NIN96642.1 DUF92 domain-containing protein [Anaerolineae bacterium]NIQ79675.1 DUF92 domain-containing protein [Anaerolineae bacterium]